MRCANAPQSGIRLVTSCSIASWTTFASAAGTHGATIASGGGRSVEDLHDRRLIGRQLWEGGDAGERFVEHDAEPPDVGAVVHGREPLRLLGGHVLGRPERHTGRSEQEEPLLARGYRRVTGQELGDAEVEDLHAHRPVVAVGEEDVRRLEVAVDDARGVRLHERAGDLVTDLRHGHRFEAPPGLLAQAHLDVLPVEELHHHVEADLGVAPHVEDLHDVLALDGARRARFAFEARGQLGAHHGGGVDDLHRDPLREIEVLPFVDGSHPAFADQAVEAVLPRDGRTDVLAPRSSDLHARAADRAATRNARERAHERPAA